jgi:protein gp37
MQKPHFRYQRRKPKRIFVNSMQVMFSRWPRKTYPFYPLKNEPLNIY